MVSGKPGQHQRDPRKSKVGGTAGKIKKYDIRPLSSIFNANKTHNAKSVVLDGSRSSLPARSGSEILAGVGTGDLAAAGSMGEVAS